MSAVDEIQAAIDRLTNLKETSTPGPWIGWRQYDPLRGTQFGIEARDVPTAKVYTIEDADLIERLHATIDAQLAILRRGEVLAANWPESEWKLTVDLARAINGTTS